MRRPAALVARTLMRRTPLVLGAMLAIVSAQTILAQDLPSYRRRLLGVYDAQTGDAIEGAEVSDALANVTALTTATGTVSLVFLPEGATLVRIKKVGYNPQNMMVSISPVDTVPLTVLLTRAAQQLPAVVTRDSNGKYLTPVLREFEERRRNPAIKGQFVTEAELRKNDISNLANIARRFAGAKVQMTRFGYQLVTTRMMSGGGSGCPATIYINGLIQNGAVDLEKLMAMDFGGIEFYSSPSQTPAQYNKNNGGCGVLLLWYRER
jgi:hypothetical protein